MTLHTAYLAQQNENTQLIMAHKGLKGKTKAAKRLPTMPNTLPMPSHLAQSPAFGPSSGNEQYEEPTLVGIYRHRPMMAVAPHGLPGVAEMILFMEILRRYAETGCPDDRRIRVPLAEAVRWAGYEDTGGWQTRKLARMVSRLSTRYDLQVGTGKNFRQITWGYLSYTDTNLRGGYFQVRLSEEAVKLYRGGIFSFVAREAILALYYGRELPDGRGGSESKDQLAARLYLLLESERLYPNRFWPFHIHPDDSDHFMSSISELLHIDDWSRQRRIRKRIEEAAAVIMRVDPRYLIEVRQGKEDPEQWYLWAAKSTESVKALAYSQGRKHVQPGADSCTARGGQGPESPESEANPACCETLPSLSTFASTFAERSDENLTSKDTSNEVLSSGKDPSLHTFGAQGQTPQDPTAGGGPLTLDEQIALARKRSRAKIVPGGLVGDTVALYQGGES